MGSTPNDGRSQNPVFNPNLVWFCSAVLNGPTCTRSCGLQSSRLVRVCGQQASDPAHQLDSTGHSISRKAAQYVQSTPTGGLLRPASYTPGSVKVCGWRSVHAHHPVPPSPEAYWSEARE